MTDDSTTPPPPEQPAAGQPAPAQPLSASDEKTYGIIAHVGMIITGFLVPLVIWLIGKDRSAKVDTDAKEALNFGILYSIVMLIGSFLWIILIGGLIQLAMFIVAVIFGIQGAMAANKGESYRYPFNWRIVK